MRAVRAAALALLLALSRAAPVAAQGDTLEVVIAVEITGVTRHVMLARAVEDRLLLPLRAVLDLARVRIERVDPGHRVEAIIEPSGRAIVFDTDRGQVRGWGGSAVLRADSAGWTDGELFTVPGAIAVALGAPVEVDWADLVVRIDRAAHLPAVVLANRARQRPAVFRPPPLPPALELPAASLVDGGVLDWSFVTPSSDLFRTSSIGLGLGVMAAGGGLTLDETIGITGGTTSTRLFASWRRAWRDGAVRQVTLGDHAGGALRSQFLRGASVTNAPFVRPSYFGMRPFQRRVPAGWTVEIYSAGALVDVVDAPPGGDLAAIDLPLRYGSNPVELVLLGPFGERILERTEVFVPQVRLPAGRWEYSVGGGACRFAACQAAGSADLRWAPRGWVTVQGGVEATWRDTVPDLAHPFARVAVAPHRAANLTLTGALGALASADFLFAPSTDFQLSLTGSLFDETTVQPVLQPAGTARQADGSLFWRPPLPDRPLYLQVAGSAASGSGGARANAGATAGFKLAGALLTTNVLATRFVTSSGGVVRTRLVRFTASRNLPGPGVLRGVFLQGTIQSTSANQLDAVRVSVARQVWQRVRADVAVGWTANGGAQVGITVTSTLPALRATNAMAVQGDGTVTGLQSFEGSVLWNTRTAGVALGPGRALGLAGVTGDVYLDANANGRRDAEEAGVADVFVAVGGRTVLTDADGRYSVWDLTPFEPTILQLDTLSVDNPLLVPLRIGGSFAAVPNAFRRVDLPFVPGAEVSGVVQRTTGRPAGGVVVELVDGLGMVVHRATTFADGSFYFLGVAPGAWTLRVNPAMLDQLGAVAEVLALEIPVTTEGTAITDQVLIMSIL